MLFKLDYKTQPSRKFTGKLEFNRPILTFPNPTIDFAYQNGKWRMDGWKINRKAFWKSGLQKMLPDDLKVPDDYDNFPIDIDKAIEIGSEKDSGCGKLVKFFINELIQMGFEFELSLPEMKQDDMKNRQTNTESRDEKGKKGFRFIVKWSYTITIKNTKLGTKISLQEFEFVLPFEGLEASLLGIAKYLWQAVTSDENLEELGKKLLDPEMLGKLLLVIGIDQLLPELIDKLVCRKPKGDGGKQLKDKANDKHEKDTKEKEKDAKEKEKDMEDVKDKTDGKDSGGGEGGGGGKCFQCCDNFLPLGVIAVQSVVIPSSDCRALPLPSQWRLFGYMNISPFWVLMQKKCRPDANSQLRSRYNANSTATATVTTSPSLATPPAIASTFARRPTWTRER